ncbi:MAG: Bor protein [Myxococcales bacterium]|nr:Bor protein [Myxococcales bacterium]
MRILIATLLFATGCYHYTFEQRRPAPGERLVRHEERKPTYLNGLVGTGSVSATKYCAAPVRTELQVRATDVLLSIATLLIYTPHTLYVTCGTDPATARRDIDGRGPATTATLSR